MSAFIQRADILRSCRHVRFVPLAEVAASFDHLVSAGKQRLRDREAERHGGLEIDDQLNLVGCWTGKSATFSPFSIRPINEQHSFS
jgi:hypothetical protein